VASANRDVVLRFHEALDKQDWSALDSLVTPDYRHHVVADTGFRALTWADFKRGNAGAHAAFPDWTNTPLHVVSEGTQVAVLLLGRGTHRGSLGGEKPTGQRVVLPIMILHEVRGGRVAADWELADTGPLMQRLTAPPKR
jgi:predicted ester cyclase